MTDKPSLPEYDETPYSNNPFPNSHPDHLATVATLFGLQPPAVDHCRVLELGCASGGNLIPMALGLPNSHFVGIDLSRRQITDAAALAEAVGLTNVEWKHLSLLDVTPELGQFDYVIAHGIYSWVPAPVRDKLLDICARNLAPNGVAFVSYNTYPGWHMRGAIRDMMCYHANRVQGPQARATQARALLDFLARAAAPESDTYGSFLKSYQLLLQEELGFLRQLPDSYLLHDHLEEVNDPVYFHQFAEHAAAKGLQFLGEGQVGSMFVNQFAPEVANTLRQLAPTILHLEQYLDFLRNRAFRQTLLCHAGIPLNWTIAPAVVAKLAVASPARPTGPPLGLGPEALEQFQVPNGATLTSRDPLMKAAMRYLAEVWPRAVPFDTLRATARARIQPSVEQDAAGIAADSQQLGARLLNCYASGLVEFHVHAPSFTVEVSAFPQASPLARLQAERGLMRVTNLRHEIIDLDELGRQVLRFLDGKHGRAELLQVLAELTAQGALVVQQDGVPIRDPQRVREILGQMLEPALSGLAARALLMA